MLLFPLPIVVTSDMEWSVGLEYRRHKDKQGPVSTLS